MLPSYKPGTIQIIGDTPFKPDGISTSVRVFENINQKRYNLIDWGAEKTVVVCAQDGDEPNVIVYNHYLHFMGYPASIGDWGVISPQPDNPGDCQNSDMLEISQQTPLSIKGVYSKRIGHFSTLCFQQNKIHCVWEGEQMDLDIETDACVTVYQKMPTPEFANPLAQITRTQIASIGRTPLNETNIVYHPNATLVARVYFATIDELSEFISVDQFNRFCM